ncbi:type 1 glutamine amidotransferase domain-containing protein [Thiomicrospira sp. WB1]|uniref:type 1 glutamine amidotransferase domain-containing protein n=1 Tax=Thiomicrospira sp. WB1 TaxID=1685380 RepID=UPI00074739B1|nr:type 1 glutamine amidotransferase domain-containing protein [Thiomicrospira sp. WB1]KUJ72076.1 glutamine amidotransferase [Thiomicrospira sp. WB1]
MQKIALLVEETVEDIEFLYPYYRFQEAGYDVDVISQTQKEVRGKKGGTFKADKSIKSIQSDDYELVFVPGGYAPDKLRTNPQITAFVKEINERKKPVAAICHGPWVLASAGVCQNRKMTAFPSIQDDLVNAGATYTGDPVTVDDNLITATDPSALPQMFRTILSVLKQG